MKPIMSYIQRIGEKLLKPISGNVYFFSMTYLLGAFCILVTDDCIYPPYYFRLFFELFLDLYMLCLLISFFPRPIANVTKCILSFLFYICAFAEVFCIIRTGTQITPSVVQLILETNMKEASNFYTTYINLELLLSPIGILCILLIIHLVLSVAFILRLRKKNDTKTHPIGYKLSTPIALLILCGLLASLSNKKYLIELFTKKNVDNLEQYMATNNWAIRSLYTPTHRFIFSLHSNILASKQIENLVNIYDQIVIDSCQETSQNIVLIIGESYNKHHSRLYGYQYNNTPYQCIRHNNGELWLFQDAVTPFNLTSDVFKNMFSTNDLSNHEHWTDYPLFTQIFHKAGYNVTFITNQYVKNKDKEFFDFSGGVFLNNDRIENTQFNHRNTKKHNDDLELLADYDSLKQYNTERNLIIFHLLGQHFDYRNRFPNDSTWFKPSDYIRSDLNESEKQIIADYDNATRYNDYVVDEIIRKFESEDAIILYLSDHGEECFDGIRQSGRIHSSQLNNTIVRNEFQIPFWIWCSTSYKNDHKDVIQRIKQATILPFFSDNLPHLLLGLGGFKTHYYNPQLDLLNPLYNENCSRLLRGNVDYRKFAH